MQRRRRRRWGNQQQQETGLAVAAGHRMTAEIGNRIAATTTHETIGVGSRPQLEILN